MNIYEIAEKANVSIATVSRVLNNSEKVRTETRKKIIKIIKDFNYKPKMIRNKLPNIMILINDKRVYISEYFSNLLNGITAALNILNFQQTIARAYNDIREDDLIFLVRERRADGILVLLSNKETKYLNILVEEEIPFLLINNNCFSDYNFIDTDNFGGMSKILEYLYKKGNRKIAYITHSLKFPDHLARYDAYVSFHNKNKLKLLKELVICTEDIDPDMNYLPCDQGFLAAKELFNRNLDFSAIACSNDELAFGTLHYCRQNNIAVPEKISVTGYDNYEITRFIDPRLTTVDQNLTHLGEVAVHNLVRIMNAPEQKVQLILKSELIEGESVK